MFKGSPKTPLRFLQRIGPDTLDCCAFQRDRRLHFIRLRPMSAGRVTHTDDGFTLIEALVGLLMVSGVVVGVCHLLVVSLGGIRDARIDGGATLAAMQRLETLLSAVESGAPVASSPADALETDTPGFSDTVDAAGTVGGAEAAYRRRWRVRPLPAGPAGAWILEVRVLTLERVGQASAVTPSSRQTGDIVVTTMRR